MTHLFFPALVGGLLAFSSLQAQSTTPQAVACPHPFGLSDNAERVFTIQDGRGRTTGYLRQRVVSLGTEQDKKHTQTTNTVLLKSGAYDAKNRLLYLRDLTFRCRQDTAFTDGLGQLDPARLDRFKDRILTFSPSHLPWPNQPAVGTMLPGGGVSVDVRSSAVDIAQVYTTVGKRRVTGRESVTTPAGTFECYKVEAEAESATVARADLKLTTTVRMVDYYAPSVGIVKSELYDKKGHLEQVRVLTAVRTASEAPDKVKYKTKKS